MFEHIISDVPYVSQYMHTDVLKGKNACGIACLAMAMGYYTGRTRDMVSLYSECEAIDGYQEGIGWKHVALTHIARNHGCLAYAEEFRSLDPLTGLPSVHTDVLRQAQVVKMIHNVKNGLLTTLSIKNKEGTHLLLITGVETDEAGNSLNWYVHDPESPDNLSRAYEKISHPELQRKMRPFIVVYYMPHLISV